MSARCNFCEFSRSRYASCSEHYEEGNSLSPLSEAVLREEVERLQSLIKRITGRDDDASFTELQAHQRRIKDVIRIVQAQRKIQPEEDKPVDIRRRVPIRYMTKSGKILPRQNYQLLKWKRLTSESLQSKFDKLRLLNERMNGIGIESMTSYNDLLILEAHLLYALNFLTQQMTTPLTDAWMCKARLMMNPKRRRRDLTKKVRVLCDFCGSSSSNRCEQSPNKQEDESLSMESEVKRLRLLTRRMTGKDLNGLRFDELDSLETNITKALRIVKKQREKTEREEAERKKRKQSLRPRKRKKEAGDKDEATVTSFGEKRVDEESQMRTEYERLSSESMQSQLERLWLLKERMSGRELGGMTLL